MLGGKVARKAQPMPATFPESPRRYSQPGQLRETTSAGRAIVHLRYQIGCGN